MLIKSTTDLTASTSAANSNINFPSLRPKIQSAELQYLIPIIGRELYNHVDEWYTAEGPEGPESEILPYMQKVVASWALHHFIAIAEVSISDGGVFRTETDNSKTAYQNQVNNLRKELMLEAQQAENLLLQYLDAIIPPDQGEGNGADLKAMWVSSPEFIRYRSLFIKNAIEFQQIFHSAQPYRNYHAIRPILYDVQNLILPAIISRTFYAALLEKNKEAEAEWSNAEIILLTYINKWLTYTTIHRAIASQSLSWDERGLTSYQSTARATGDDDSKRGHAQPHHINHYAAELQRQADEWKTELSFYLDSTATNLVFKEYYEYKQALTTPKEITTYDPTSPSDNTYGLF